MAFALCGIPLSLVTFQSIGERLNTLITFLLSKTVKIVCPKKKVHISHSHLIVVSSSVGGLVILVGTYVFHRFLVDFLFRIP